MNEPYTDTWQMYFAPQIAARNRWATPGAVHPPERRRRTLPRGLFPGLRRHTPFSLRAVAVSARGRTVRTG